MRAKLIRCFFKKAFPAVSFISGERCTESNVVVPLFKFVWVKTPFAEQRSSLVLMAMAMRAWLDESRSNVVVRIFLRRRVTKETPHCEIVIVNREPPGFGEVAKLRKREEQECP
jgi:hypothetical protein